MIHVIQCGNFKAQNGISRKAKIPTDTIIHTIVSSENKEEPTEATVNTVLHDLLVPLFSITVRQCVTKKSCTKITHTSLATFGQSSINNIPLGRLLDWMSLSTHS